MLHGVKDFMSKNSIVMYGSTFLSLRDHFLEKRFESIGQNIGNGFVIKIGENNWLKMIHRRRVINLGNESNISIIEFL
jgi:predicted nuclease of restriction endonuclease-like (RecB) superfamily